MIEELLDYARGLIARPEGLGRVWPRAVALLTRQALEETLDYLWAHTHPGMEKTHISTKLACLDHALPDRALVVDARAVWASLSRACHHHHYELDPIAAELELWIHQTQRLVARVSKQV